MINLRLPGLTAGVLLGAALAATPSSAQDIDSIHVIIPGGAGGGWDSTARGVGEALTRAGLVNTMSFENMSGGGGGRAIAHFVESAESLEDTLMVQSTPIIMRSLQQSYAYTYDDVTPIAMLIGDYSALFVRTDSPIENFADFLEGLNGDGLSVGGGALAGGMDHIVASMVVSEAGAPPEGMRYIPYDGGGNAVAGLLSGEIEALSEQISTIGDLDRQGEVRVLCITAPERMVDRPDVPTCAEEGANVDFANWRGLFGPPGMSDEERDGYVALLQEMVGTEEWEDVRARNSWVNIFMAGTEFDGFIQTQAESLRTVMTDLGFL